MSRIQITSSIRLLFKDLKSGFINQDEFDKLYKSYKDFLSICKNEKCADHFLDKAMTSYYKERYENRKAESDRSKKETEDTLKAESTKKFEEYKRELYLKSVEERNYRLHAKSHIKTLDDGLPVYIPGIEKRISMLEHK